MGHTPRACGHSCCRHGDAYAGPIPPQRPGPSAMVGVQGGALVGQRAGFRPHRGPHRPRGANVGSQLQGCLSIHNGRAWPFPLPGDSPSDTYQGHPCSGGEGAPLSTEPWEGWAAAQVTHQADSGPSGFQLETGVDSMPATWPVALATRAWPGCHMPTCSGLALCWGSGCGGSPSPTGGLPSGPPCPCPHPCGALPAPGSQVCPPSLPPRSPQPTGFPGSRPSTGLRPPFPVHVAVSCLVVTSPTTVLPLPGPPARSPERDERAVSRVNSPTGLT